MSINDIVAMAKDRGFNVIECPWGSGQLFIFRGLIRMGDVNADIDYEKLDLILTEYVLKVFE